METKNSMIVEIDEPGPNPMRFHNICACSECKEDKEDARLVDILQVFEELKP